MTISIDLFCQSFPLISQYMDHPSIAALLDNLETQKLPRGQILINEDKPCNTYYLLLDGSLDVTVSSNNETLHIGKITSGGCAGLMSMLDNADALATVTADTDCTLLALSDNSFSMLNKQNPVASTKLLRALSHIMSDRIRAATDLTLPLFEQDDTATDHQQMCNLLENAFANLCGLRDNK